MLFTNQELSLLLVLCLKPLAKVVFMVFIMVETIIMV